MCIAFCIEIQVILFGYRPSIANYVLGLCAQWESGPRLRQNVHCFVHFLDLITSSSLVWFKTSPESLTVNHLTVDWLNDCLTGLMLRSHCAPWDHNLPWNIEILIFVWTRISTVLCFLVMTRLFYFLGLEIIIFVSHVGLHNSLILKQASLISLSFTVTCAVIIKDDLWYFEHKLDFVQR